MTHHGSREASYDCARGPGDYAAAAAPVTAPAVCLVSGTLELQFDCFAMKAVYMRSARA